MIEEPLRHVVLSKAEALILLATADTKRCQGSTFLLRVLSNYAAVGADVGSERVKKRNPRRSVRAAKIYENEDFESFRRKTINEHPEPLAVVWGWLLENRHTLTPEDIITRIWAYPMVTITREEDKQLNQLGFRHRGEPEARFAAAEIVLADGRPLKCGP